jgi:peroxiredoxin family protein
MGDVGQISIIVFSGTFDRIHFALATASAAAATNISASLFFTMGAISALSQDQGWTTLKHSEKEGYGSHWDHHNKVKGIASFEELLEACVSLEVKFFVCEMGMRSVGLESSRLRTDVPIQKGGLVTFLADVGTDGKVLFI